MTQVESTKAQMAYIVDSKERTTTITAGAPTPGTSATLAFATAFSKLTVSPITAVNNVKTDPLSMS